MLIMLTLNTISI